MKKLFENLACLVLLVALTAFLPGCNKAKKRKQPEVGVKQELPQKMNFKKKIRLQGNVEPSEYTLICAKTDGTIDIMNVDEGDRAEKGKLLFQSDKLNLESQLEVAKKSLKVEESRALEAEANLALANAKLEKAQKDYDRSSRLLKHHAVAEGSHEKVELEWKEAKLNVQIAATTLKSAHTQVEQAKSNVNIAQKYYDDSLVKAPFHSVVTRRYKEEKEYAKKGDCILRIENPERLELSFLLSAKYYPQVIPGKTKAIIYSELGEKLKETPITYKSPTVDPESRTFEIEIKLLKKNSFVSGMLCDIDLILDERDAWGVPNEAVLLRDGHKNVVFTVKDGKAKEVVVEKGISDNGFTELKGIDESNIFPVVVEGQAFLNNGTPAKIIKNGKEGK